MKRKIKKNIKRFVVLVLGIIIIRLVFPTWTPEIKGKSSISTLEQIEINGAMQEVMIRGYDKNNPVLIFVHGGPGCSEIPYVRKYQDLLEKDFTIVHYDQRGSGKSYHFLKDYSNLSSKILVDDLLALTDYISKRLGQEKVLLAGHSYGTYIAMQAAAKKPKKFSAYIGIGQMADTKDSEIDSLNFCIEEAQKRGNSDDVAELEGLRAQIEEGKKLTPRGYVRKYGGAARLIDDNSDATKGLFFSKEYNLLDAVRYFRGLSSSQNNLLQEVMENNLSSFITKLDIPCYFVMGKYDYMTSTKTAKDYFDKLQAPKKEFIEYSNSAHYPQFEEKEKFAEWLKTNFGL